MVQAMFNHDTTRTSHLNESQYGVLTATTTPEEMQMGQPYKGDRVGMSTKIPRADADKLALVVKLTGESRSEIMNRLLRDHLQTINIESLAEQGALPMARAS